MEVGGVLKTTEDYVKHAAALQTYSGDRLQKATLRYPTDAQHAFDKYAGAAILRYDRNLTHARDLHAVNVDLREYKVRFAQIDDFDRTPRLRAG